MEVFYDPLDSRSISFGSDRRWSFQTVSNKDSRIVGLKDCSTYLFCIRGRFIVSSIENREWSSFIRPGSITCFPGQFNLQVVHGEEPLLYFCTSVGVLSPWEQRVWLDSDPHYFTQGHKTPFKIPLLPTRRGYPRVRGYRFRSAFLEVNNFCYEEECVGVVYRGLSTLMLSEDNNVEGEIALTQGSIFFVSPGETHGIRNDGNVGDLRIAYFFPR